MPLNLSPFSIIKERESFPDSTEMPEQVQTVNTFVRTMQPILEVYERQWHLNIQNYIGNQFLVFDRISRRFIIPPAPTWRVRLVINKVLPISRSQMAKLHEINPVFYVAANSTDEKDVSGARIGTKVTESIFKSEEFDDIFDNIIHWMVLTGNYYLFPFYNSDAGREIVDTKLVPVQNEQGQIIIDPQTQAPVMEEKEVRFKTGDVAFDEVDPFELIPDFSTTKWKEQSAVVKRKLRSVTYVKEKYGVDVSPEVLDITYASPIKTMSTVTSTGITTDLRRTLKHAVTVKDYYEAPSDKFRKGRHLIVANNKLLFEGELETKLHGKLSIPFVPFQGIKVPKRLLGMAPIENILPLQWQYNRGRSAIVEDINVMSRPKYRAPIDSVSDDIITDQPGEVVIYDPAAGEPPDIMGQARTIEPGRVDNLNRLDQEMQDIGGVHDISLGRLPRRATSGLALNILEEKDTTVVGPMKKSLRKGLEKAFSFALSIAGDKFKETRVLKLLSERMKTEIERYKGSDLHSNDDVRILTDQPFPQSRAARLEFAVELVKQGLISAQTARKIIQLDGFSNIDNAIGDEESRRIAAEQQAIERQRGAQQGEPTLDEEAVAQEVAQELRNGQTR